ncbi:hypothetical protein N4G62_04150 [Sphingomonas sanguinis]|uniref:Uncharacterized protein n=1 Tax=Sphingomonas sanguinis TaxID=33051 RepID=A0ABU5LMQ2_9SPHN|nr:hypothetical protein [Sphingomonas sanguinis]MDZ7281219.1 hypothetical protein [Sphingomonas sanguinis]
MLLEWLEMRETLVRFMHEHRTLCHAPRPDPVALSRNRWLLSNASRRRAAWMIRTADAIAERLAHTTGGAAWPAVQADMRVYRGYISEFVSRWPIDTIIGDWDGYRRGVVELRPEIARWLRKEEFAIRALAAELEAETVTLTVIACRT